jgi:hypothetical protein
VRDRFLQKGNLATLAGRPLHDMQLIGIAKSSGYQQLTLRREAERSRLARIQIGVELFAHARRRFGDIVEREIAALARGCDRIRSAAQKRRRQQQQINSNHHSYVLTRRIG